MFIFFGREKTKKFRFKKKQMLGLFFDDNSSSFSSTKKNKTSIAPLLGIFILYYSIFKKLRGRWR